MEAIFCAGEKPNASHFLTALSFSVGFLGARFLLDNLVFKCLARRFLTRGVAKVVIDDAKQSKIVKCSEAMWKLTYYASVQLWVISILQQEPWSTDTNQYFKGWPNQELRCSLKLFYMCQCGFYVYSIAALLTWETRRKDFSIMMSHHIITSILIRYSFFTGFFRIGTVILALHDASDVFLEAAKVFKYSEKEMGASVLWAFCSLMACTTADNLSFLGNQGLKLPVYRILDGDGQVTHRLILYIQYNASNAACVPCLLVEAYVCNGHETYE